MQNGLTPVAASKLFFAEANSNLGSISHLLKRRAEGVGDPGATSPKSKHRVERGVAGVAAPN